MQGKPFVNRAGQLLDAMFAAIDHGRTHETNPLYAPMSWCGVHLRTASRHLRDLRCSALVERHVELVNPDVLVLMGNVSCLAMLKKKDTRPRQLVRCWPPRAADVPSGVSAWRQGEAWHDLLMLQAKLRA